MLYITSFNTIFVILCFIYVYLKEKEYKNKRDIYAQIFENITQEIHFVKKSMNEHKNKIEKEPKFNEAKMKESIKQQTISILNEVLPSIIDSIHKLDKTFNEFKKQANKDTSDMQKKVKEYSGLSSYNDSIDERQVLRLYDTGQNSEDIANKLGLAKSEVDLVIKMHNK